MEITDALAAELSLLSAVLDTPEADLAPDVARTVRQLMTDVHLAVPSFVGLTITVMDYAELGYSELEPDDLPAAGPTQVVLRFTLLDVQVEPADIGTSLRIPESTSASGRPRIEVILYAATAGAFVDMAADHSFLTGRRFDLGDLDQHRAVAGSADIIGVLSAESTIREAIGVLIGRGRTPDEAYAELDALAALADTDRITEATEILNDLMPQDPEESGRVD